MYIYIYIQLNRFIHVFLICVYLQFQSNYKISPVLPTSRITQISLDIQNMYGTYLDMFFV